MVVGDFNIMKNVENQSPNCRIKVKGKKRKIPRIGIFYNWILMIYFTQMNLER